MKLPNYEQRDHVLEQRRVGKMAESAHAYVRGNTLRFYEWLESDKVKAALPNGPELWICGDCHTGNLGPVANADGKLDIQIRDVDQTVIGNPVHDLLRLGLSLAMAARSSDLPGVTTALMLEEMIDGYLSQLLGKPNLISPEDIGPIDKVMRQARARRWKHLAEERIKDVSPKIPLGRNYWAITDDEHHALKQLFKGESLKDLVGRITLKDAGKIRLVDAAYWMKGCSSLGKLRFALLISVGRGRNIEYRLLDMKQAVKAVAPHGRTEMPPNNAERVVEGARALSPYLGERMLPVSVLGKDCVLRELRPQDMKFDLRLLTQKEAVKTARLMAGVVGRAHGRQLKRTNRVAWAKQLRSMHAKGLDAPRWLWSGVLDLAALHEAAYLEHCRRYALGGARENE